jgi:hypothetical protein
LAAASTGVGDAWGAADGANDSDLKREMSIKKCMTLPLIQISAFPMDGRTKVAQHAQSRVRI